MSYSETRYRDQSITAGALVPFVDAPRARCRRRIHAYCSHTPPVSQLQSAPAHLQPDCRAHRPRRSDPLLWQAGLDTACRLRPGSTLNRRHAFPYLLARDALFASDFEGERKRPAANVALQCAPNDTSEYTLEAFYQGYREEMFNNLHFTFADWWGALGPDPASTITMYQGTNLIKTRTVGFPFGFNSGDSTEQATDTLVYALNGKWQISER